MKKIILFILVFTNSILIGQFTYSGNVHPLKMIRTSDQSEINLPFRLATINANYTLGAFDLVTNSAIEYRWDGDGDLSTDLREAYLAYFPDWGEVKLGKQIHAWGMVDGNNPTDNLNAYDYYFMFMPGADRKLGSNSASINMVWGDYQFETVIIPEHSPNRLTFGEDDFPIQPPMDEPKYLGIENPMETGFRLRGSFPLADISISYFKGHDRSFSLLGYSPSMERISEFHFGFRETKVYGANFVTFLGNFTIRGEGGFFSTENNTKGAWNKIETKAEYLQYVFQGEMAGPYDIALNAQYIGSKTFNVEGQTISMNPAMPLIELTDDSFTPGMGTPFAMFAENGLSVSATGWLMDDRLELSVNSFLNLDENGYMLGARTFYSPSESWGILAQLSQFIGDVENPENPFTKLEDFSHIQIGIKYSF